MNKRRLNSQGLLPPIRIIIYESSSLGGCYQYAQELYKAYSSNTKVKSCSLYLPKCAIFTGEQVHKKLLPDQPKTQNKLIRKLLFFVRIFINPMKFGIILLKQPPSTVLLNDFEQLSAPIWSLLYQLFLKKHAFGVYLHDPDRDAYPPNITISSFCMKRLMAIMSYAFYHEKLPQKKYYQHNTKTRYVCVPHGIYQSPTPSQKLLSELEPHKKDGYFLMSIIGNIREEKNYRLIIEALKYIPNSKLVIAGKEANSSIDLESIKQDAEKHQVTDRVIWLTRYLSNAELASVIEASDAIVLYYKASFTSQSAVLNTVAPFKKKILVSDGPSSLAQMTKQYKLGIVTPPDSLQDLVEGLKELQNTREEYKWDDYLQYASWENHVQNVLRSINTQQE